MELERRFTPKVIHVVLAAIVAAALAVLVYSSLTAPGHESRGYTRLQKEPVTADDVRHIYTASYDGKCVLISVKDVVAEGGFYYMVYDLKLDFVPIASRNRCKVDFISQRFDFMGADGGPDYRIPLGSGSISRSPSGKIRFVCDGGLEFLQL